MLAEAFDGGGDNVRGVNGSKNNTGTSMTSYLSLRMSSEDDLLRSMPENERVVKQTTRMMI